MSAAWSQREIRLSCMIGTGVLEAAPETRLLRGPSESASTGRIDLALSATQCLAQLIVEGGVRDHTTELTRRHYTKGSDHLLLSRPLISVPSRVRKSHFQVAIAGLRHDHQNRSWNRGRCGVNHTN
jgi:hypothetical protein